MKSAHTPTPWTFEHAISHEAHVIVAQNDELAFVHGKSKANAKRIVHCVNLFDELVFELESLFNESIKGKSEGVTPHQLKINDLIKRAKGGVK